jgi:biopolymer transport protein ExbB
MLEYLGKGGPVMWPLLVLSVLGATVTLWRWLVLQRSTRHLARLMRALRDRLVRGDTAGAVQVCEKIGGPVASVVKAGLLRFGRPKDEIELSLQDASAHELTVLEHGLPVLATTAMVAPLLGFLGTVTGMINSFEALAAVGLNNPAEVAKGISEALITTAAGLIIAIPVQMAYNYFVTRINTLVRSMEAAANLVLQALADLQSAPAADLRLAAGGARLRT